MSDSNNTNEHWFIGPTIHKSINLGGSFEWKLIWNNILENYSECVFKKSNKVKFYWMLTSCLGKILLHENINYLDLQKKLLVTFKNIPDNTLSLLIEIENSLIYNFDRLFKTFIYLSFNAAKIILKNSQHSTVNENNHFDLINVIDFRLKNVRLLYKEHFSQLYPLISTQSPEYADVIKEKTVCLQNALKQEIEQLFYIIYNFFDDNQNEKFDPFKLLPDEIITTWNHLGPIFWLWFHITASKLKTDSFLSLSLKEFFNNIDIFISCGTCKQHFQNMRQSDYYQFMKQNLSTDLFFIEIHQIVRKNHFRAYEGNEKFVNDNVFKNSNFIYKLREEYTKW